VESGGRGCWPALGPRRDDNSREQYATMVLMGSTWLYDLDE
jgi:hypothetical protein